MDRAEAQLQLVRGDGPRGAQALEKQQSALKQITSLRAELASLSPLLDAMPAAVGADGKRTYLVAIMNPAEMRASGGAPLSVAFVRFKDGKMSIPLKGATSALTRYEPAVPLEPPDREEDPFQIPAGEPQRFVNTDVQPELRRVRRADGAGDQGELRATRPTVSSLWTSRPSVTCWTRPARSRRTSTGRSPARTSPRSCSSQGYKTGSDAALGRSVRHDVNDQLMTTMLSRLTEGGGLIAKMQALRTGGPRPAPADVLPRRRLCRRCIEAKHMAGTIPSPATGNLTAVYTQNGNASKMDVFQHRTVRGDGAAAR